MKKTTILLSFVFLVAALTGCTQLKISNYQPQVDALDVEMDSTLIAEEELDEGLAGLEVMDFASTDDLDSEFENTLNDELQIDEELDELESMDL